MFNNNKVRTNQVKLKEKNGACHNCSKPGHHAYECRLRGRNNNNHNNKNSNNNNGGNTKQI